MSKKLVLFLTCIDCCLASEQPNQPANSKSENRAFSVEQLQLRNFLYFRDLAHPTTGLIPDRWPTESFSSIAACGFGLTSYIIGVENKWITRESGAERTHKLLKSDPLSPRSPSRQ